MPRFPLEYDVTLEKGSATPMEIGAGHRPPLPAGPPPEFGGSDAWWSPEHLLVSSVAACFAATFFAAAGRANLHVGKYRCKAKGTLDRTPDGVAFTSVHLDLELHVVADEVEHVRRIAESTKAQCFVARSLRCPVTIAVEVVAS